MFGRKKTAQQISRERSRIMRKEMRRADRQNPNETNFVYKGTELIEQAVRKDNDEEYESALSLYSQAIQYLMAGLKYETDQYVVNKIKQKVQQYLNRAENIKSVLSGSEPAKKSRNYAYHDSDSGSGSGSGSDSDSDGLESLLDELGLDSTGKMVDPPMQKKQFKQTFVENENLREADNDDIKIDQRNPEHLKKRIFALSHSPLVLNVNRNAHSSFLSAKASGLLKQAQEKETASFYDDALHLYTKGLYYVVAALQNETNKTLANSLTDQILRYLQRAENIKKFNGRENFVVKGTEIIKEAVYKDNEEYYDSALALYCKGTDYLLKGLEYERNENVRNAIKEKVRKYSKRAQDIKVLIVYLNKEANYNVNYNNVQIKEKKGNELNIKQDLFNVTAKMNAFTQLYNENVLNKIYEISSNSLSIEKEIKNFKLAMNIMINKLNEIELHNKPDPLKYKVWDCDMMIKWIESLENGKFSKYIDMLRNGFKSDGILCGKLLPCVGQNDLMLPPFGIKEYDVAYTLAQHFERLKQKNIVNTFDNEGRL